MEYPYIPTGIKGEMVRSGMDCHRKGQVVGTVGRRPVAIHSSGQTISSLAHIEGITLGMFSFACPTVISSIPDKNFHFPFPYFVI